MTLWFLIPRDGLRSSKHKNGFVVVPALFFLNRSCCKPYILGTNQLTFKTLQFDLKCQNILYDIVFKLINPLVNPKLYIFIFPGALVSLS